MIPTAVPWAFFCSNIIICFGTTYDANLEILSCHVLFYQPLHTSRSEEYWRVPFKIHFFARFSLGRRPSNKVI